MDTKTLIADAKARFSHNAAKAYLKEKYDSKFIVADQGGLWKANLLTINFLSSVKTKNIVLIDDFGTPVKVDRKVLLTKLQEVYSNTMEEWYKEWKELEGKR